MRKAVIAARFEMLLRLFGDEKTNEIFSEGQLVQSWLDVEVALSATQAKLELLEATAADAVALSARIENVDLESLWSETQTVGYPILPLIRQIDAVMPGEHRGRLHVGATTQDIMDTALALQLRDSAKRQDALLVRFGDRLAHLAQAHASTTMAARTHAQQAVPTVLGVKFAVYLAEVARQRVRLTRAAGDVAVVSLFGAGGTSASYGDQAQRIRQGVADRLGLGSLDVPWHVARDSVAAFSSVMAAIAATCARFAREVIDLSRTEIGEVAEADGYLRGASSAMPQKRNPIYSEGVVGLAASAEALSAAMLRAMEAGHERAAGEWQIEWQVLPQIVCLCSAALLTVGTIADELRIFPDQMRENLLADGGLAMAEAYMMRLAPTLGRAGAFELVYEAARQARETRTPLINVLREMSPEHLQAGLLEQILPDQYLGDSALTIQSAVNAWRGTNEQETRRT